MFSTQMQHCCGINSWHSNQLQGASSLLHLVSSQPSGCVCIAASTMQLFRSRTSLTNYTFSFTYRCQHLTFSFTYRGVNTQREYWKIQHFMTHSAPIGECWRGADNADFEVGGRSWKARAWLQNIDLLTISVRSQPTPSSRQVPWLLASASPCLHVSLSPCLRVSLSKLM